jgi:hypothetical protein
MLGGLVAVRCSGVPTVSVGGLRGASGRWWSTTRGRWHISTAASAAHGEQRGRKARCSGCVEVIPRWHVICVAGCSA